MTTDQPHAGPSLNDAIDIAGRVLLVEDDDLVRDALDILLSERLEVDSVDSAEKAMDGFLPGRYDLLVTDLGLPGRPGDELRRALQQIDPGLAAILVTGADLLDGDPRLEGFESRWQKPLLDLDELLEAVVASVHRSRRRRAG